MSTAAQTTANQANAQLSTGPRTAEGKAASSRNALTHGLTSTQLIIAPGEEPEFNQLLDTLSRELLPEGALETVLFNDLVHAAWQKRRIRAAEAAFVSGNIDTLTDPAVMAQLERYRRYHGYHHRLFRDSMTKLAEIQRNRQLHAVAHAEEAKLDKTLPPVSILVKPAPKPRARVTLQNDHLEVRVREVNRRTDLLAGRVPPDPALASFRQLSRRTRHTGTETDMEA